MQPDETLPTPETCLRFAYAALKDGKNPDLATAWATLAKTITVAISATRTIDVAMAANRYMLDETEENKDVLRQMLAKWNELP